MWPFAVVPAHKWHSVELLSVSPCCPQINLCLLTEKRPMRTIMIYRQSQHLLPCNSSTLEADLIKIMSSSSPYHFQTPKERTPTLCLVVVWLQSRSWHTGVWAGRDKADEAICNRESILLGTTSAHIVWIALRWIDTLLCHDPCDGASRRAAIRIKSLCLAWLTAWETADTGWWWALAWARSLQWSKELIIYTVTHSIRQPRLHVLLHM